jgi:hypothetical protein
MTTTAIVAAALLTGVQAIPQLGASPSPVTIQTPTAPLIGTDAIVGEITNQVEWGSLNGIAAYSFGITVCNVGSIDLHTMGNTNQHPVYAQNVYRVEDGRFEQIGMGWPLHEFAVVQGTVCAVCQPTSTTTALGAGCSSPHSAGIMGVQSILGMRSEINGFTGEFAFPHATSGQGGDALFKRVQILEADIDVALHPRASYLAETQCVAPDDAANGNGRNNASWCSLGRIGSTSLRVNGPTQREEPAILAWAMAEPTVLIQNIDVPGEGRFIVGSNATELPTGMWRFTYAIYNGNSDFSGSDFSVTTGVTPVSAAEMSFPVYHSGEPYSNLPWTSSQSGDELTWSTESFAQNPNANALRWGTTYSFSFESPLPPRLGSGTLGLFKPNSPGAQSFAVISPEGSGGGALPFTYCATNENSTGEPTLLKAIEIDLSARTMTLQSSGMPSGAFGFFLTSLTPDFVPNAGGSAGNLCLGGTIGRGVGGTIFTSTPAGTAEVPVSLDMIPTASGTPVSVQPMEVRYFQTWHRDSAGGTPTSNFSNGVGISFP